MYYDEDLILDLRLNLLDKRVTKFVVVEADYLHNGKKRSLKFDISKFSKFKDKIIYVPVSTIPKGIKKVKITDTDEQKNSKILDNALKRENFQRKQIELGLKNCSENDLV